MVDLVVSCLDVVILIASIVFYGAILHHYSGAKPDPFTIGVICPILNIFISAVLGKMLSDKSPPRKTKKTRRQ